MYHHPVSNRIKHHFMKKIIQRARAKTPSFFSSLRNISLVAVALATALLTAPVAMPAMVTVVAGYLLTAGTVASAISQLTVQEEEPAASPKPPSKGGDAGNIPQ